MKVEPDTKVREYFSQFPHRLYPKGQILIFADEDPEHVYYLTKGRVVQYDSAYNGDELIVNVFKPGAFFPMSWALNRSPNRFFYRTDSESELHVVHADAALQFLSENSDVALDLLERVYRGTEGVLQRMVQLMTGTAKSRLMLELMIEAKRFGEMKDDGSVKINISEQDLAARSGMSRETVNREMRKLKSSSFVNLKGGSIVITDVNVLEQALSSSH
ncbi:Crp/Fnr family transcriptional regulator [Patescibacteria group bacterium]|jgi:CRP-like cAMP-binding protein|nr:Crp/Fnr family transcriptional regulator [Patescibacteria group bacterium]